MYIIFWGVGRWGVVYFLMPLKLISDYATICVTHGVLLDCECELHQAQITGADF